MFLEGISSPPTGLQETIFLMHVVYDTLDFSFADYNESVSHNTVTYDVNDWKGNRATTTNTTTTINSTKIPSPPLPHGYCLGLINHQQWEPEKKSVII